MTLRTRLERLESLDELNHRGQLLDELNQRAEQMRAEGRRVVVCPDNPPGRQLFEITHHACAGAIVIRRSYLG